MQTILIVDDDFQNNKLLETVLANTQRRVVSALNVEDGLKLARQFLPALIIMDMRLPRPGMNGIEAIEYIRADNQLRDIPVIVVCAANLPEDREIAFAAGCDAYVPKPYRIAEFKSFIEDYIHPVKS